MADNPSPILRGATDPPEDAIAYLESVPIEKFLGGISRFQKDVHPKHQELFEKLAMGQRPEALFNRGGGPTSSSSFIWERQSRAASRGRPATFDLQLKGVGLGLLTSVSAGSP